MSRKTPHRKRKASNSEALRSLFRRACEPCSSAKTKCDGQSPCDQCLKKNQQCTYAVRRKRGPKTEVNEDTIEQELRWMMPYQRKIWALFLVIFKNQRRHANDNVFSWTWYKPCLERLEKHVQTTTAIYRDKTWETLKACCLALIAPSTVEKIVANSYSEIPHGAYKGDRNEEAQHITSLFALGNISVFDQTEMATLFSSTTSASMIMESCDTHFAVFATNSFHAIFGTTEEQLQSILQWSKGGFLPWGLDLLAPIIVHKNDIYLLHQMMSSKHQISNIGTASLPITPRSLLRGPAHGFVLPSLNTFECWTKSTPEAEFSARKVTFMYSVKAVEINDHQHFRCELTVVNINPIPEITSETRPKFFEHGEVANTRRLSNISSSQNSPTPTSGTNTTVHQAGEDHGLDNLMKDVADMLSSDGELNKR